VNHDRPLAQQQPFQTVQLAPATLEAGFGFRAEAVKQRIDGLLL
jgi:hypothetical protein